MPAEGLVYDRKLGRLPANYQGKCLEKKAKRFICGN